MWWPGKGTIALRRCMRFWTSCGTGRRASCPNEGERKADSVEQQQLPGCFPSFQITMSLLCLYQRIGVLDAQFQFPRLNHVEHSRSAFLKLLRRCDVGAERWTGEIKRTFLSEDNGVKGWYRAT